MAGAWNASCCSGRARGDGSADFDYDVAVFIKNAGTFTDDSTRLAAVSTDILFDTRAVISAAEPRIGRDLVIFFGTAYQFRTRADYAVASSVAPVTSAEAGAAIGLGDTPYRHNHRFTAAGRCAADRAVRGATGLAIARRPRPSTEVRQPQMAMEASSASARKQVHQDWDRRKNSAYLDRHRQPR